jgi:hypothetical protein
MPEQRAEPYSAILKWLTEARETRPGCPRVERCAELLLDWLWRCSAVRTGSRRAWNWVGWQSGCPPNSRIRRSARDSPIQRFLEGETADSGPSNRKARFCAPDFPGVSGCAGDRRTWQEAAIRVAPDPDAAGRREDRPARMAWVALLLAAYWGRSGQGPRSPPYFARSRRRPRQHLEVERGRSRGKARRVVFIIPTEWQVSSSKVTME